MDTHLALSFPDCFSDPDADTEPMSQDFPVFKDDCAPQQRFQGGQWIQNSPEMPESQRSRDTFDQEGRDLGYSDCNGHQFFSAPMILPEQLPLPSSPETLAPPDRQFTVPAKKTDDSDPACRPRLTADQTAILEEYYSHTPRPTTKQKREHAIRLGLTLEKVNNWFQNRRAKTKQQSKNRREFELIPLSEQMIDGSRELQLREIPASPLRFSEVPSSLPMYQPSPATHSVFGGAAMGHGHWGHDSDSADAEQVTMEESNNGAMRHHQLVSSSDNFASFEAQSHSSVFSRPFVPSNHFTPGTWFSQLTDQSPQRPTLSEDKKQLLLQQPLDFDANQVDGVHFPSNGSSMGKADQGMMVPRQSQRAAGGKQLQNSVYLSPEESPVTPPLFAMQNYAFDDEASRRGSVSSELANNFGTFHLHRGNSQSQHTSDEEIFKTPDVPISSLAARRKQRRPAALVPMRTVSASAPVMRSPPCDASVSQSVLRRIKSTGNNLNVANGRIQKNGGSSTQKSPLHITTFQEAGAFDRLQASATPMPDQRRSLHPSEQGRNEAVLPSQGSHELGQAGHSPQESSWQDHSPVDSLAAPPLSASFTQRSYEESHMASPPVTPFAQHPMYVNHWTDAAVPQSAPAHITSFANYSPPMLAQPTTPGATCPAGAFYDFDGYYEPTPHSRTPVCQQGGPPPQSTVFDFEQSTQIVRPCSSTGGQFSFFAAPPPQRKELEVVMTTFPEPEGGPRSHTTVRLPQNFTFQNSGPKDFAV